MKKEEKLEGNMAIVSVSKLQAVYDHADDDGKKYDDYVE